MIGRVDLRKYPKLTLVNKPTEIQYLSVLSNRYNLNIYIKREDLNGIGFGGNKIRKLEFLLGEAKSKNATHILTLGAIQSNHARLTAITSRMMGFEVELFLKESVDIQKESYQENGNIVLNQIVDCKMHRIPNDDKMMDKINQRMEEIRQEGGNPYFIPVGGSNSVGNLGYIDCYLEILEQQKEMDITFDYIATASGSGGTHGGLLLGSELTDTSCQIKAYNVQPEHEELLSHTIEICNETLQFMGYKNLDKKKVDLNSKYSGHAYGFPEVEHLEMLKGLASQTGIFLDPVYTAKAFTGLIREIEEGSYPKNANVLFIHTGGTPGIFAYKDWF